MAFQVHFLDRRDGARCVRTIDSSFDQLYWCEGNGRCDANRASYMYPHDESKQLLQRRGTNIIVVEKIVIDGATVYADAQRNPPADEKRDRYEANILAVCQWLGVLGPPGSRREQEKQIVRVRRCREALAAGAEAEAQLFMSAIDAALTAAEASLNGRPGNHVELLWKVFTLIVPAMLRSIGEEEL